MKILYIHQYFSLASGSDGLRSYKHALALRDAGYKVTIFCLKTDRCDCGLTSKFRNNIRSGEVEGINIIQFNINYSNKLDLIKRSLLFLKFSYLTLKESLKDNYQIVYATSTPLTIAIPGILSKLLLRRKFVFEVRDQWPELPYAMGLIKNKIIYKSLLFLEYIAYHSADICIALAPGIVDGIKSKGVPIFKIKNIPNSCDLEIFKPLFNGRKKKPQLIKNDGLCFNSEDFVAVFTGAHGIANGLDSVLDMAKVVKSKGYKDIKFLFIGDGKCKEHLIKRTLNEEISNCFFISPVTKFELAEILRESINVGLMVLKNIKPFYRGTSPNKFFDYISSGLAVINNYPGWLADLIDKYNIGIAVPPEDPFAFAEALIFLYKNPLELNKMSCNARQVAEKYFSREAQTEKLIDIFDNISYRM